MSLWSEYICFRSNDGVDLSEIEGNWTLRSKRTKAEREVSAEGNSSDYKMTNTFAAFKKPGGQAAKKGREERQTSRRACMQMLNKRGKWPQKRRNNRWKCQRLARKIQQNRSGRMVSLLLCSHNVFHILEVCSDFRLEVLRASWLCLSHRVTLTPPDDLDPQEFSGRNLKDSVQDRVA